MTKIPVYRGNLPAAMGSDYEFSRILTESGEAKAPNYHKPYKDYANIPEENTIHYDGKPLIRPSKD